MNMKKAMRVTMKRVQTIFVRRKPKDSRDENSTSNFRQNEGCGSIPIENGLEVSEVQDSTEPSPEPLEVLLSSDEEDRSYFKYPNNDIRRHKTSDQVTQNKMFKTNTESSDDQGACGPIAPTNQIQHDSNSALVPVNDDGKVVAKNMFPSDVLRSCTDLEKLLPNPLLLEFQDKILGIQESLLWLYPPYYDFCVIASENDYEESVQFKNYVATTFGLIGCTLYDGFSVLGADRFENYEKMMDNSSKVFFFITENFTSNAFCKRLQSGAVFRSLISKIEKDKEKCVPVFPHGFQQDGRIPLALLGIAGLNPTEREITYRSLANTYSPRLRQRRHILNLRNYEMRCLEFEVQVKKCIEEYNTNSIQYNLSEMSLAENDHVIDEINHPIFEALPPVVQLLENEDTDEQTVCVENYSIKSSTDIRETRIEKGNEKIKQEKMKKETSDSQNYKFMKNPQNGQTESKDRDNFIGNEVDHGDLDEVMKNLPDGHESVNNSVSTVNITDSATVHVGNVYNITINQASPSVFSHLEQNIKSYTTAFSEKDTSERYSDSSD